MLVYCPINTFIPCVIPAEAGIQNQSHWIPVSTGMTKEIYFFSRLLTYDVLSIALLQLVTRHSLLVTVYLLLSFL
jgi:hypothetical protein